MTCIHRHGRRWSMIELMSWKVFTFGYHTSNPHKGVAQVLEESRPVLVKRKTWWQPQMMVSFNGTLCTTSYPPYKENKQILLMTCIHRWGRRWSTIELMSQKVFTFGYCTSNPHKGVAQVLEESRPVLVKRKTWQQPQMMVSFDGTFAYNKLSTLEGK